MIFFTKCIFLIVALSPIFQSHGQTTNDSNKSHSNNALIDVVLKKINKISSESIQNMTNDDGDKELNEIESNLKKAAVPLGEKGEKYVKLIMRGIRSGKNKLTSNKYNTTITKSEENNSGQSKHDNNTRLSKIDFILERINKISLDSIHNVTNNKMEDILSSVENKLKAAAIPLGDKGEKYVNLIMRGIRNNNKNIKINRSSVSEDKRRFYNKVNTGKSRNTMLNYIIERIDKLSIELLSDISNDDELERKLALLESKLRTAAQPLGKKGEKYIGLIMRAVRLSRNNNIRLKNKDTLSQDVDDLVQEALTFYYIIRSDINNVVLRKPVVKRIASAIEKLVKKYRKPIWRVEECIEDIKLKIIKSIKRNDIISNDGYDRSLIDLITDGINMALINLKTKRRNIRKNKNDFDTEILYQRKTTNSPPSQIKRCMGSVNTTCTTIRNMKSFKCSYISETISINKLCDGKTDCADRSDEKHCTEKAIDKLRYSRDVMTKIDISLENDCFTSDINASILSKQNLILRDVLKAQLAFIEKYDSKHISELKLESNEEQTKSAIKEITGVISTLSIALDKALCSRQSGNHALRRFNEVLEEDEDDPLPTDSWPPKTCSCQIKPNERCLNCTYPCKRICWHKISLSHWNCDSVNETSMVPLNVICDGKFDCMDESDEKGCFSDNALGRFEAHKMFTEITNSLKMKVTKDYNAGRNKVWTLISALSNLEKLSLNTNPNPALLRHHRNECFTLITLIYTDLLKHTSYAYEAEDLYLFLLSINQQLGNILKRIGTGNKKIISDGCFCKAGKCATSFCTRKCEKACAVELKLTRYYCEGKSNKSIHIDNICDGINDCILKDDERDCNKEVCRSHHITVLRLKVQDVGLKQKGTAMGEILSTWKTKVTGTLKVAERAGKPTPRIIKDIVKDLLRDLVLTYGSVEEYRRKDNNYALQDFTRIARSVQESARSCGK